MACTKFLRNSNTHFAKIVRKNFLAGNSKIILQLQDPIQGFVQNGRYLCYSTTLVSRKRTEKRNNLIPFASAINSISYLSTNDVKDSFRVVITDPSKSTTTEFVTSEPSFSDSATTLTESGATAVTDFGSSFSSSQIADSALSLSNDIANVVQAVEPTFESLGLCHWTPVGLVQMFLEYLHISCQMPWWSAIVACTITVRFLLFPLLIKTQRNAINASNYMPQLQFLQAKFGEARRSGNSMEASKIASEMMEFMKVNQISPIKNAMLPMLQAPVFISFFFALRSMARVPIESMKEGGIWWATDLTIPDPYYIMPVIACSTLYVVLKLGAESGVRMDNLKMAKYVLQALPIIALPFCINFPAAVLYYWVSTNFCTLAFVSILKIAPVRQYFNLPTQKPTDPKFVVPKKGFVSGVKESYQDQKILAAVEDRRRMDEIRFQKAGTGPIPRTYSYDPTKPRPSNVAASASRSHSSLSTKEKTL